MPRTGEKAEAALQQRVQTAVRDYKISLSVQRRTDLDERVAATEARRKAARKQPEKALAPPPRTTSPVNLKPKANLPRSSSGRSKKGSKQGSKKGSKKEEQEEDEESRVLNAEIAPKNGPGRDPGAPKRIQMCPKSIKKHPGSHLGAALRHLGAHRLPQ